MWALNSGGTEAYVELFSDDFYVVQRLSNLRPYQVEVQSFRKEVSNKYRILKLVPDPSTPRYVYKKELVGEFDDPKELVAIARLILASETS